MPSPAPLRIAVAGMGLIGGSLYKSARRAGLDVSGFDRGDPVDVRAADVVFVALPPQTAVDWVLLHAPEFKPGAVVVDTCGVKASVCRPLFAAAAGQPWTFVGGHPMAGKEVSGFANSSPDLFHNASMILVPPPDVPEALLRRLAALFDRPALAAQLAEGATAKAALQSPAPPPSSPPSLET